MKVILQEDVKALGQKGEVVEVKDGYARNYLLPRGLAVEATRGNLREVEQVQKQKKQRKQKELELAEVQAQKLGNLELNLSMKSGDGGRLFGAVTSKDIAERIEENSKVKIDRRKIGLKENLKNLGTYMIPIRLHPQVTIEVKVNIVEE